MTEFLDELARSMAKPMPRGRALRLLGTSLVAAAVPLARPGLRTARASGFSPCPNPEGRCPKDRQICGCAVNQFACYIECCDPKTQRCCVFPPGRGSTAPCERICCPLDRDCGSWEGETCVCRKPCGNNCCTTDEFCANFRQSLCCKRGWRGCNLECCNPNEECRKVRIGTGSKDICTKRCPPNQAWCGKDKCCPPKWKCIKDGQCKRCWPNEEECGKKCCDRKTTRCCGKAGCCPTSRACCNTANGRTCCPPRHKCRTPILRGDIGPQPKARPICCPPERVNSNPDLCCPPGMVALNTPGFRIPPPGIPPDCCPRGQICGSGASKFCANLQSDPANCGSCGNVCASGICSGGICALP